MAALQRAHERVIKLLAQSLEHALHALEAQRRVGHVQFAAVVVNVDQSLEQRQRRLRTGFVGVGHASDVQPAVESERQREVRRLEEGEGAIGVRVPLFRFGVLLQSVLKRRRSDARTAIGH